MRWVAGVGDGLAGPGARALAVCRFVGPGGPHNGERIADYTYDVNQDFLTVSPWTARHTADIYGYFAAEAALRKIAIPLV